MQQKILVIFLLSVALLGVSTQTIFAPRKAVTYPVLATLSPVVAQTTSWQTNDTIILSLGKVDWTEKRFNPKPSGAQAIGWIEFHQREHFVSYSDIFLDLSEKFNWSKLSSSTIWKDFGFDSQFPSWDSFVQNITKSAAWWLEWSWGLNTRWYGISANSTVVQATKTGDVATVAIWCHVSKVSEYLVGHSFETVSFDLYSIDLGKMEVYEYYYDATSSGQSVYLHFSAPSTILIQEDASYVATVRISPLRQNTLSEDVRSIDVVMPPGSEVKSISPSASGQAKSNHAIFTVSSSDRLPASFTVTSGPHTNNLVETIIDTFTSPQQIIVMAGVVTLTMSGISGTNRLRKRRIYNRTARLMAKIYHDYKTEPEKLHPELDRIHDSLYRLFTEDKITDDHFERLLGILDKIHKEKFGANSP